MPRRKGLDQKLTDPWQHRLPSLDAQPVRYLPRQVPPFAGIGQDRADPGRQIGRERKFAAGVEGNLGGGVLGAGGDDFVLVDAFETQDESGEQKRLSG